jgi:hypothetical protein
MSEHYHASEFARAVNKYDLQRARIMQSGRLE